VLFVPAELVVVEVGVDGHVEWIEDESQLGERLDRGALVPCYLERATGITVSKVAGSATY
jgi:hypothetical protein